MDTFGFTQKKFLAQDNRIQHRHIIQWLLQVYQKLVTNRISDQALRGFSQQYQIILKWCGIPAAVFPKSSDRRLWVEAVSDRIHFHRTCIRPSIRDEDLLLTVQTRDDSSGGEQRRDTGCIVALESIRSSFNTGSIFRTCEASGFWRIILGNTLGKADSRVQKTAMGSQERIKEEKTIDLAQTLMEKKEKGYRIIGVETIKAARPYYDHPWQTKSIVVFGNEEYGISKHVMAVCDTFVRIPMFGSKNSINIANAVSVICFHAAVCMFSPESCPVSQGSPGSG